MTKKIFAMFLAVLMVVSMLPTSVFAAEGDCPGASVKHTLDNCNDWTKLNTTAPTCGDEGYTSYRCNKCGKEFIDNIVAATGDHTLVPGEAKAPTCEEDGYEAGLKCENCDYVIPGAKIDKLGKHEDVVCLYGPWSSEKFDCTEGYVRVRECVNCGNPQYDDQTYKACKEHDMGDWFLDTAATATEKGVAKRVCQNYGGMCNYFETKDVYFTHIHTFDYVPQQDKTCYEDGVLPHYECRLCKEIAIFGDVKDEHGVVIGQDYIPVTAEDLRIPADHDWAVAPTCDNRTQYCNTCKGYFSKNVSHNKVLVPEKCTAATCTDEGWNAYICSDCGREFGEEVDALTHIDYSFSVPATCGTYAYTYTICLREGCDVPSLLKPENRNFYVDPSNGMWFYCLPDYTPVDAPVVGVPMNLEMLKDGTMFYFTGNTVSYADYRLEISDDADKAVQVFLETVEGKEGAYYLYFISDNDEKTYIEIYEYQENKPSLRLTTKTPETCYGWNATFGMLTTVMDEKEYWLGVYGNKGYIQANDINYLNGVFTSSSKQWPTSLSMPFNGTPHVINVVVDYESELDPTNHRYMLFTETNSTCLIQGYKYYVCVNHDCPTDEAYYDYKPLADCAWRDATAADFADRDRVTPSKLSQDPTCTIDGFVWQVCTICEKLEKNTVAAEGHNLVDADGDKNPDVFTVDGSHLANGYTYNKCTNTYCECANGEVNKKEVVWAGLNKTWKTVEEAMKAHNGKLEFEGVFRQGSCTTEGVLLFKCTDKKCMCWKGVYVYQYTPAKNGVIDQNNLIDNDLDGEYDGFITGACVSYSAACVDPSCPYWNCADPACIEAREGTDVKCNDATHFFKGDEKCQVRSCDNFGAACDVVGHYCPLEQAPGCEDRGWTRSFKCDRCGKTVGNTRVGYHNWIEPTDHDWVANEKYVQAPHDVPNFSSDNYTHECATCGALKDDGTKILWDLTELVVNGDWDSTTNNDEYPNYTNYDSCTYYTCRVAYMCWCGDMHFANYVTELNFNHSWIVDENDVDNKEATCYAYGHEGKVCKYCGITAEQVNPDLEILNKVAHTTKEGVSFNNSCLDASEDRHCVVCHKHADDVLGDHDELGKDHVCTTDCPCYIEKEHVFTEKPSYVDASCTTLPYILNICDVCDQEVGTVIGEHVVFAEDENGNMIVDEFGNRVHIESEIVLQGHHPKAAKMSNGKPVRHNNYEYFLFTPVYYVFKSYDVIVGQDENGFDVYKPVYYVDRVKGETYWAEVDAYLAPSYTADGYFDGDCRECMKKGVHQVLPKLEGLGMEMDIKNTLDVTDDFAVGSLVEVVISANGANLPVQGFEFDVDYTGLIYVGYEIINNDFVLTVTDPEDVILRQQANVLDALKITGRAANDATGKMQNITITEKTPLVKLLFRVVEIGHVEDPATDLYGFGIALGYNKHYAYEMNSDTAITLNPQIQYAAVRDMFDFNGDGFFHITDLLQAESLLTFEHPDKTYDVTLDVNKDGEITPEDLTVAYNLYVGNLSEVECFLMGIDAEEAEFLMWIATRGLHEFNCVNPTCSYGSDVEFIICPWCYAVQGNAIQANP